MNHRQFSLLIADDEAIILRGLADSIPWESIDVRVVARELDGLSALRALEEHRPDVAVVDICMPHCDGLTMIERACELGLDTSFIILSGYDDFAYAQRAIRSGVAAYLLKPINKQDLMNAVREQCARRLQGENADLSAHSEPSYRQLLADIAVGHARNEEEIRAAFSRPDSPLPFEGACVILIKCPLQMHDTALRALEDVLFICPHAVFLQELDQIDIAVHIASSGGGIDNLKKLLREYVALLRTKDIGAVASMGTYAATLLELPLSLRAARNAQQYALYELPDGVYDAARSTLRR